MSVSPSFASIAFSLMPGAAGRHTQSTERLLLWTAMKEVLPGDTLRRVIEERVAAKCGQARGSFGRPRLSGLYTAMQRCGGTRYWARRFMEFALIHGNDFFVIPLSLEVGSVCMTHDVEVVDTFGGVWRIPPIDEVDGSGGQFHLFKLEGATAGRSPFVLAPSLVKSLTGPPLEEVGLRRRRPGQHALGGGAHSPRPRWETGAPHRVRARAAPARAASSDRGRHRREQALRRSAPLPHHRAAAGELAALVPVRAGWTRRWAIYAWLAGWPDKEGTSWVMS
jgi:hypothetical protein